MSRCDGVTRGRRSAERPFERLFRDVAVDAPSLGVEGGLCSAWHRRPCEGSGDEGEDVEGEGVERLEAAAIVGGWAYSWSAS